MRTVVSDGEVANYRRDGFLVMEEFLSGDELTIWRESVEAAAAARLAEPGARTNAGSGDYYQKVFTQLGGLRRLDEALNGLLCNPELGRLAATLSGADAVRIWLDQALFKPPFGNPTAWHLDTPYWSFKDRGALTVWIALDDATVENGCMWYLPGTHHDARFDAFDIGSNLSAIFDSYPEWRQIESRPAVLPAGGAVWHNGLTAHGAGANMTAKGRRAMTCAFMPDGVIYNGSPDSFVFTDEEAAELVVGQLLNDEEINPLVWSRTNQR